MTRLIGALDQGTTSTRFILFDRDAHVVAVDQREHRQHYPRPGWVEHDPVEILRRSHEVIAGALARAGASTRDLAAVGITNQRETTVIWDRRTGEPIHPAIVWQDTRTDTLVSELAGDGGQDRFRERTGLPLATYFSGPKARWLLDAIDGARTRAEAGDLLFGTIDTWLVWNLTGGSAGGVHVTDVTNASRTQLMDLASLEWSDDLLTGLGVPRAMLPTIAPSAGVYAHGTGPLAGVPIAAALGDQQAALFGQACFEPGDAKNTYGTGCFLLVNTGPSPVRSRHGLITTVGYRVGDEPAVYALEGSIAIAGALVQWLRDELGLIGAAPEVEALARTVDDNGGVHIVPAFSGLFAPYWRSDARGAIVGLTRFANRGHLARAALEAVAWQVREVVDAMSADTGMPLAGLRVDGGMVGNELLMQLQADVLGIAINRPAVAETTALGAATAAGLAVGFWSGLDELRDLRRTDRTWHPVMDGEERERRYATWRKAVTRTFDWVD